MLKDFLDLVKGTGLQVSNIVFMLMPVVISTLCIFLAQTPTNRIVLICLTIFLLLMVMCHLIGRVFISMSISSKTDKSEVFSRNQEIPNISEITFLEGRENEFSIESSLDNREIYYYVQNNKNVNTNKYVMLLHGFSGSHKSIRYFAKIFYDLGYNIITMDLRGHGNSKSKYIGMGILDAKDLLDVLNDFTKKNKESKIALFGVSMGAATVLTALNYMLPKNVTCVIEDSGYTSVKDEFKYQLKNVFKLPQQIIYFANPSVKCKAKYSLFAQSSIDGVKKSTLPILFIHGTEDKIVPKEMVDELYENCSSKKAMIKFKAGHIESAYVYRDRYSEIVKEFIEENN